MAFAVLSFFLLFFIVSVFGNNAAAPALSEAHRLIQTAENLEKTLKGNKRVDAGIVEAVRKNTKRVRRYVKQVEYRAKTYRKRAEAWMKGERERQTNVFYKQAQAVGDRIKNLSPAQRKAVQGRERERIRKAQQDIQKSITEAGKRMVQAESKALADLQKGLQKATADLYRAIAVASKDLKGGQGVNNSKTDLIRGMNRATVDIFRGVRAARHDYRQNLYQARREIRAGTDAARRDLALTANNRT